MGVGAINSRIGVSPGSAKESGQWDLISERSLQLSWPKTPPDPSLLQIKTVNYCHMHTAILRFRQKTTFLKVLSPVEFRFQQELVRKGLPSGLI